MMPPWFADPRFGHFSNDPSLSEQQIAIVLAWVRNGSPAGSRHDAPPPRQWTEGWNIAKPDAVLKMPSPVIIPSDGDVEYTYEIVPTHFTEDKWVQMAEVHPSSPQFVHHAVVYIRPPVSNWLRHAPVGKPFTASTLQRSARSPGRAWNHQRSAPGVCAGQFAGSMAGWNGKVRSRGLGHSVSDPLHNQWPRWTRPDPHRTCVCEDATDATGDDTLQLNDHAFIIPPGADDFRVETQGTLPHDADSA